MKKIKWWVFSIAASVIGSFVYDYWKVKPILSTLVDILKEIWKVIVSILIFELRIWWLLVACILIIGIIYIIRKFQTDINSGPEFIKYKEDKFKEWKWTWDWRWNDIQKSWVIFDLQAYCPKCGKNLLYYRSILNEIYECPNCDFKTGRFDHIAENRHHIEALIIDKTNRK